MSEGNKRRRVPWVALALSLLSAGVGHVYCGRMSKGLTLYFAWLLVPCCSIIAALGDPSPLGIALLLIPSVLVLVVYAYAAVDAWRTASRIGADYSLREYNRTAIYVLLLVVQITCSCGLVASVRGLVYEPFIIPSKSMSPTILAGDRVLARKWLSQEFFPHRGDLIVFRNPTSDGADRFMGRVIAVAGDEIEILGDRVTINGQELDRDRVPDEALADLGDRISGDVATEQNAGRRYLVSHGNGAEGENAKTEVRATVPKRHVFVMGDNRDRSRDSRHFGSIHANDVVGCVDYLVWPVQSWKRFGVLNGRSR